jgi:hypothetical protein
MGPAILDALVRSGGPAEGGCERAAERRAERFPY